MASHPKPVGTVDCRCGRPAVLRQSHTTKNPNRWFFKCDECGFYKFADTVPGYPTMPSASQSLQQQQTTPTPQQAQQHQHQSPTPVRLPRYSESPARPLAYNIPGSAGFGGPQQQTINMQQQAWPQQIDAMRQQQQPQVQQQPWQQQQLHSSPHQPRWQPRAPPDQQQQQQVQWASPQFSLGQLGQQVLQQQQQQQSPYQGYGSQGSGSQVGTQGSQGVDYSQQGSQHWQQQPQSQWHQSSQLPPHNHWQQQPQPQQQDQQPWSPQGQQLRVQQDAANWQHRSPLQQQHWGQQQPPSQQVMHCPSYDQPAGYSQQQQPYNSPLAASPVRGLASGAPPASPAASPAAAAVAAAAVSPGQGIVVRVYPAPVELDMPHHLALKLSGYHPNFVSVIKDLPYSSTDRHWHKAGKVWLVLTRSWDQVKAHLEGQGFTVRPEQQAAADRSPGAALDMSALESSDARLVPLLSCEEAEQLVSSAIPADCWDQLMPHQQAGVLAGLRRRGRLLLADEMGLGKTAQAIVLACCYPQHWPLLVVLPASLRGVWCAELQAWTTPQLKPASHQLRVVHSGQELRRMLEAGLPHSHNQVLVLTYDLVKQLPAQTAARFGVVIADESHHLKNKDAQRTQAVSNLVRGAAVAVLITGTPLLSRPIEVWSQVDMLRPGLLGSYDAFGSKYCTSEGQAASDGVRSHFPGKQYYDCNRSHIDELHRLLLANVMVRRTKEQVGLALPTKTRMKVCVPLDPAIQPQLSSIRSSMQLLAARNETDTPEAKRLINEYRIASGRAKVPGVLDFVQGLPGLRLEDNSSDNDEEQQPAGAKRPAAAARGVAAGGGKVPGKILVFAYHREVLNVLQSELCDKQGLRYVRIDGSTSPEVRHQLVSRFQNDPSVRVGLLAIKAAGAGVTLTAADRVVFAELHWNPSDLNQAEDRVHRMGQAQHCMIYYCMAAECADELMWGTIVRKLRIVGAAVDGQEGSSSQGLGHLESWSQKVQGQQVGVGVLDAAAVGGPGGTRSPGASQQEPQQHQHHQQQQHTGGAERVNTAVADAAVGGASSKGGGDSTSRRRCLLDEFDAQAADGHRALQLPGLIHAGASAGAGAAATTAGVAEGNSTGICGSIELTGGAGNEPVTADAVAEVSGPGHMTGATLPVAEAAEKDHHPPGPTQQQRPHHDGSQTERAATQGSQSTLVVGQQHSTDDDDHHHMAAKRQRQE